MTALLDIACLRLDAIEAQQLTWYWCAAEAEMGYRSALGDQLERAEAAPGRNKGSKPLGAAKAKGISQSQADAALAHARVSRRLARLHPDHFAVLRVYHGPLLPTHRQHEPTHTGGGEHSASRREDRPLAVFADHLGLVLYLTAKDGVPIEKVIEVARRASEGTGPRARTAGGKVAAWLRAAELALVEASAAYAATSGLV